MLGLHNQVILMLYMYVLASQGLRHVVQSPILHVLLAIEDLAQQGV